jgi:aspartate carbamoyltransferase catalytic subunit
LASVARQTLTRRRAQRPVILNQMENGIAVRIAVLEKVIG